MFSKFEDMLTTLIVRGCKSEWIIIIILIIKPLLLTSPTTKSIEN